MNAQTARAIDEPAGDRSNPLSLYERKGMNANALRSTPQNEHDLRCFTPDQVGEEPQTREKTKKQDPKFRRDTIPNRWLRTLWRDSKSRERRRRTWTVAASPNGAAESGAGVDCSLGWAYLTGMTIRLKPELEALIQQDVQRGPYQSADEFVERAVQMLHDQEQWLADNRTEIAAQIEHGYRQAERGELVDGEEAFRRLREQREKRTRK
jgi:antitoxin ParD1/3/4